MSKMHKAPKPSNVKTTYKLVVKKSANPRQLARSVAALRKQITDDFGRPDVPSDVRLAVRDYAGKHGISLSSALDTLIAQASSYEALKSQIRKQVRKLQRNSDRLRDERRNGQQGPRGAEYEVTRFFQGGAPGLGKVCKARKSGRV